MKAIVQDSYGSADTLRVADVDKPVPEGGELLVRVHAAGAGPDVWHLMKGEPRVARLVLGVRKPKVRVRGWDVAGRVEAIGTEVAGFRPGDEIFGICDGSFAEYARVRTDRCARKPENLTFEQAAAVPISGSTALQAVGGRISAGRKVLVIGAAGGVGTYAVQLAKALGADVTGVCSTSKTELVRSIGADHVIDYTREDFADRKCYDLIVDTAGNRSLAHLRRALEPGGTAVIVGGEGGGRWFGDMPRTLRAQVTSPFSRRKVRGLVARVRDRDLAELRTFIEDGKVTPVIDRTYKLEDAPDAIRYWETEHTRGKVVITV
ncbi:NAD(P)-dependent alcohol dehydrogenase [Spirillospora sp. NPDC029432]|uniref:NAD(P)-dependent alcohol dehydrogenase n=1 Tax=Spirillospora sp. NPDC029432 TaxID=3154599 RepID=UPI003455204E